jgi:protein kinase A
MVREDLVVRERDLVSKLSNRFICGYYKSQHDENNFYIFLEYVRGLSLIEVMNEFGILPNSICKFILASIATAIDYLHSENIIYRNLNNSNILVRNNGQLAIVDFSCSKKLVLSMRTSTLIGNPYYMAPEMI